MEIEYFVNPHDTVDGRPADEDWHDRWIEDCQAWFKRYGLRAENLQLREHEQDELAHYAKRTVDIVYRVPHRLERARWASPTAPTSTSSSTRRSAASR